MKRMTRASLPLIAAIVVLAALAPTQAATPAVGDAQTSNVIVRVSVGSDDVEVGIDRAEAERGASRRALASFIAGRSAALTVGALERSGTQDTDSGADEASEGDLALEGLAEVTIVDASAGIELTAQRVASSAASVLADVDLLGGLVTMDGITTTTATLLTDDGSEASRTITLDGVQIFDVGGLLAALGVDDLALPCAALEAVAAELGLDAATLCDELAAAEAELSSARDDLSTLAADLGLIVSGHDEATVQTDRDAAAALSCDPLDVPCITAALGTLVTLATTYGVTLGDPTDLASSRDEILAELDTLLAAFDDLDVIGDAVDAAAADACETVTAALDTAAAAVSALDPAGAEAVLTAASASVSGACTLLRTSLDSVLGTPVLTLDDVSIELSATAAEGDTSSSVTVSIGSLRIGFNDAQAIVDLAGALAATDELAADLAAVVTALGVDALAPQIDLFAIDTSDGQDGDGSWFARASLSVVRITLPGGPVSVPDDPPFGILGAGGGGGGAGAGVPGALGAAPAALLAATVSVPAVVVDGVVFDADAAFKPATVDDPAPPDPGLDDPAPAGDDDARTLPLTGAGHAMLAGALLLAAAYATKRFLAEF